MLLNLYIENIAVIEKMDINFQNGLNVLTGETGAGKSIVIDAINAILGERVSKSIIRTGKDSAFISATFVDINEKVLKKLEDSGCNIEEDGTLIIQREIKENGKGICRVNSRPVPVSILREIGLNLINIHGQHECYELLSPELHIAYIDNMAQLNNLLNEYKESFLKLKNIKSKLDDMNIDISERERKIDLLKYQVDEIEEANLSLGELEDLKEKKELYVHSEKISESISNAKKNLVGSEDDIDGGISLLEKAYDYLNEVSTYLPKLGEISSRIKEASYEIEDCLSELNEVHSSLEYDPNQQEIVEERLDLIYKLFRKYGDNIEEIFKYLEKSKIELEEIETFDQSYDKIKEEFEKAKENTKRLALELSEKRKVMGEKFAKEVKKQLEFLDMPRVNIVISQERCPLNILGCDNIEILISTNPGEPPKPAAKIASGGELSRIMLAIKNVLANKDEVSTLIFDEVDTGISGSAAQKVGLKLREVSKDKQVICVTHLAQIAALAKHHYLIEKTIFNDKTYTNVKQLSYDERKMELARIIGGLNITELTLDNAEEMLTLAGNID